MTRIRKDKETGAVVASIATDPGFQAMQERLRNPEAIDRAVADIAEYEAVIARLEQLGGALTDDPVEADGVREDGAGADSAAPGADADHGDPGGDPDEDVVPGAVPQDAPPAPAGGGAPDAPVEASDEARGASGDLPQPDAPAAAAAADAMPPDGFPDIDPEEVIRNARLSGMVFEGDAESGAGQDGDLPDHDILDWTFEIDEDDPAEGPDVREGDDSRVAAGPRERTLREVLAGTGDDPEDILARSELRSGADDGHPGAEGPAVSGEGPAVRVAAPPAAASAMGPGSGAALAAAAAMASAAGAVPAGATAGAVPAGGQRPEGSAGSEGSADPSAGADPMTGREMAEGAGRDSGAEGGDMEDPGVRDHDADRPDPGEGPVDRPKGALLRTALLAAAAIGTVAVLAGGLMLLTRAPSPSGGEAVAALEAERPPLSDLLLPDGIAEPESPDVMPAGTPADSPSETGLSDLSGSAPDAPVEPGFQLGDDLRDLFLDFPAMAGEPAGDPGATDEEDGIQVDLVGMEDFQSLLSAVETMNANIEELFRAIEQRDALIVELSDELEAAHAVARRAESLAMAQNEVLVRFVAAEEKLETAETLIVDLSRRIASVEGVNPADREEVDNRLASLEQGISGLSTDIGLIARVMMNGSPQRIGGRRAAAPVFDQADSPMRSPAAQASNVPSNVQVGDFVNGFGAVLEIFNTSDGGRMVVMENGTVILN